MFDVSNVKQASSVKCGILITADSFRAKSCAQICLQPFVLNFEASRKFFNLQRTIIRIRVRGIPKTIKNESQNQK